MTPGTVTIDIAAGHGAMLFRACENAGAGYMAKLVKHSIEAFPKARAFVYKVDNETVGGFVPHRS